MRPRFTASARRHRAGAQADSEAVSGDAEVTPDIRAAVDVLMSLGGLQGLAWHEETKTMLAILDNGIDAEPFNRVLTTIEGVEGFDYEWEQVPDGWFTADLIFPLTAPDWMTSETASIDHDHALAIELASKPL